MWGVIKVINVDGIFKCKNLFLFIVYKKKPWHYCENVFMYKLYITIYQTQVKGGTHKHIAKIKRATGFLKWIHLLKASWKGVSLNHSPH